MSQGKKKILIVEDEFVVRESLREWLTEDGYEVECVDTGEKALEEIKKQDFGFVILDLRLPGMDGLQVFESAKQLKPDIKGAMITAYPLKETWEKASNLGILGFLPKPFNVKDLEEILRRVLGEAESEKKSNKHLWLQLGAGPYRLCDRNYECHSCPTAQSLGDYDRYIFLSDDDVEELKKMPDDKKFCRYGAIWMSQRKKPYLE